MDEFEKIAADAIRRAEAVKCSFEAFVRGLRSILIDVKERLDLAESEAEFMRKKERSR